MYLPIFRIKSPIRLAIDRMAYGRGTFI